MARSEDPVHVTSVRSVVALEPLWRRRTTLGRAFRAEPLGVSSGLMLLAIVLVALLARWVTPYDPLAVHPDRFLQAPSSAFPLGTDHIGRDILSRILAGAGISLFVAFVGVVVGDSIGALIGVSSGYFGGKLDLITQRLLEVGMSFPTLILAFAVSFAFGAGVHSVIIAITITRLPLSSRIIRSVALSVRERVFIEAARGVGASELRIMFRHVAPQCISPFLVLVTAQLGSVIVLEAGLSFLGAGVPLPTPTWGNMLSEAISRSNNPVWWIVVFPGLAITVTVGAFTLFGDAIRDWMDPEVRGLARRGV